MPATAASAPVAFSDENEDESEEDEDLEEETEETEEADEGEDDAEEVAAAPETKDNTSANLSSAVVLIPLLDGRPPAPGSSSPGYCRVAGAG